MLLLALAMLTAQAKPVPPLPSANQMAWHARQYYAFVHFGPNTFTGNEWGQGTEDPNLFNPTQLDCRQWCKAFKQAGMSGVIITAKHHDGFALWQSKLTKHGVMSSKWHNGKGDVLKDLSAACKEYGLWMGVYLSPWDRNHPTYGTAAYNDTFVGMLKEVLTKYGDMKEVWFDGANGEGPNGKKQVYDWPRFEATVRKYAPHAVIFGDGGDVRWVGNESGFVGETNWNFLPSGHWPGDQSIYDKLFEGDPKGDKYSPGECDVSIRPGWFWRRSEDAKVKSLEQLKEIWYRSVGHGGNLLLNVPANDKGLISAEDIAALTEFKKWRDATFVQDLAAGAKASSSAKTKGAGPQSALLSKKPGQGWQTPSGTRSAALALSWPAAKTFDHVVVEENVAHGQLIKKFHLEADGKTVFRGTTVGYRRVVHLSAITTKKLKIVIDSSRGAPALQRVGVYCGPPSVDILSDSTSFLNRATATIRSDNPRATVLYTTDGTAPTARSKKYAGPISIERSCVLKAIATFDGRQSPSVAEMRFTRFEKKDLWPATYFIRQPDPGLRYSYYEQGWHTLDQMKDAKATATGVSTNGLDLALRKRDEQFALVYEGVFTAPQDEITIFKLTSDDGSRLYIDGRLVVDNDGLHGMETKQGTTPLAAGYHRVRVEYFNASGGMGLRLEWQGPGVKTGEVPISAFRH